MTDELNVRELHLYVSAAFYPLLTDDHRYLVMAGGKGSGKSEFAARKLFVRCMSEGGHVFLVLRKVRKTAHRSTAEVFRRLLSEQGVDYKHDRTHNVISFASSEGLPNEILFDGLDEPEKIKSIKGLTGVWIEEATEFTERDFLEVDLSLREPTDHYKQIILTFNPDESLAPWLKRRFFPDDPADRDDRAFVHTSTIEDNPIDEVRRDYLAQLDAIQDDTLRQIYRFGVWAQPQGKIYNWPVVDAPPSVYDEIFYGLDFGYTVNPAVIVRIYRRGEDYWLEEVLYETKLTNSDVGQRMKDAGIVKYDTVYADSAEPKSIDELCTYGTIIPALKGPDSVRAGIDTLKGLRVFIVAGSSNIIKEASTYKWREDKNGDPIPEPVKFNDHAMDAVRYGITTHLQRGKSGYIAQSGSEVW